MKFQIDQTLDNSGYFFELVDDAGSVLLASEPYKTTDDCKAAIQKAIDLLRNAQNYKVVPDGDLYRLALIDADGNVLAQSGPVRVPDSAEELQEDILEEAAKQSNYDVTMRAVSTQQTAQPAFLGSTFTDFESLYDFTLRPRSAEAGLEFAQSERDGQFYAFFKDASGKPVLFTRGYKAESQLKRRLVQVIKNAVREDKFDRLDNDGKFLFVLNGSNGQEIARSPMFDTAEERDAAIRYLVENIGQYAEEYAPKKRSAKDRKKPQDTYQINRVSATGKEGFETYRDEANRLHYFMFNDNHGKPLLFSQGYSAIKSRDNGIRSVIKNGGDRSKYEFKKQKDGQHYFVLRAGNRQEISRSRNFIDVKEAEKWVDYLVGTLPRYALEYGVSPSETTTAEETTISMSVSPEPAAAVATAAAVTQAEPAAAYQAAAEPEEGGGIAWGCVIPILLVVLMIVLFFVLQDYSSRGKVVNQTNGVYQTRQTSEILQHNQQVIDNSKKQDHNQNANGH